ncbi:MAG TPA: helix-turn-helix domain-containing protein [Mycobacteriales bacterium]|nr:helix-turn-helix domain-containing protein [Mycobacteriales bacterium]
MPPSVHRGMSTGERIAAWRVYRGVTQEACAGLVGKSLSWWKKVEQGVRHVERLSDLALIAQILNVRDLADLTGGLEFSLALDRKREHPQMARMRAALAESIAPPDGNGDPVEPVDPTSLQADLTAMWAEQDSPRFVWSAACQIPPLLRTATAVRWAAEDAASRRRAMGLLCEAYIMAGYWFRYVSDSGPAQNASFLAQSAALESGDPRMIALAAWLQAGVLKDLGQFTESVSMCERGAAVLEPGLADDPGDHRALWGHLQLQAALNAAHAMDDGTALRFWDRGDEMSRRLGPDYVHPITVFGRANVGIFLIRVNTALGKAGAAITAADRTDISAMPAATSRALALVDVARCYVNRPGHDDVAAVHMLRRAEEESPDIVAFSTFAHEMTREIMRRGDRTVSAEIHDFARRIGIFT